MFISMKRLLSISVILLVSFGAWADKATDAWAAVQKAAEPPAFPKEWLEVAPTAEQIDAAMKANAQRAASAAMKAGKFVSSFPDSSNVAEATELEDSLYQRAVMLGHWESVGDWVAASLRGKDVKATSPKAFETWVEKVMMIVNSQEDYDEQTSALANGTKVLMAQYPKRDEVFALRTLVATRSQPDQAKKWANDLVADNPPAEFVEVAQSLLKRLSFIGKEWDLKFTDMNGKKVDLKDYRGKVVLVTFWATWCGPCMKEMPRLMAIRDEYRSRGYEMIGISFDTDERRMRRTVNERDMKFPQFFDGKSWNEGKGDKYGIITIPAEWLVDKQGVIRDINAREKLEEKIEALLAE